MLVRLRPVLVVVITLFISGCELIEAIDQNSEGGVGLRSVDIQCLVTDTIGCSSSNNGVSVRVGIVDNCDTFTSYSTIYSVAEGIADCDVIGCDLRTVISSNDFTPSSIAAGTYDLYAFIDEDNDDRPDTLTEPIGCLKDVVFNGTTSTVNITTWD